jgi:hypothetical protein
VEIVSRIFKFLGLWHLAICFASSRHYAVAWSCLDAVPRRGSRST